MCVPSLSGVSRFRLELRLQHGADFCILFYLYEAFARDFFILFINHAHIPHLSKLLCFHHICIPFAIQFCKFSLWPKKFHLHYFHRLQESRSGLHHQNVAPVSTFQNLTKIYLAYNNLPLCVSSPFLTFSTPLLINVTPCTLFWRPRPVPPH